MNNINPVIKPQRVDTEKIIKRETAKLLLSGGLLILLGASEILLALAEGIYLLKTPAWANLAGFAVVVLAMVVIYSRPIIKSLIRSSQDEYEYHVNVASKAKAYDFLVPGALSALVFNPGVGVNGLLAIVLGVSLVLTAREGGHLDV